MRGLRRFSLRIKIILMFVFVSLVVIALLGTVRTVWELRQEKAELSNEMSTLAQLLGNRSAAALVFADHELAAENLAVLNRLPHVIKGCLYFTSGELAGAYMRDQQASLCPSYTELTDDAGIQHKPENLHALYPIEQDQRELGTIFLVSDLTPVKRRIQGQLVFAGISILMAIPITWLLAGFLQRLITVPLAQVTHVARSIRKGQGEDLRARVLSRDEIGELAENFNSMLDTLQQQSRQLEQAQTKQKDLLSRYKMLFENASDAIFLLDQESGQFLDVNPIAVERYGYSHDEFLSMRVRDIAAPDVQANIPALIGKVKADGYAILEVTHCDKSGNCIPVEVSSRSITLDGRPILLSFVRDISERKLAEEKIRELSEVVEQSPNPVMITDTEGNIVYINPAFETVTGFSEQDALGHNPRLLKSGQVKNSIYDDLWRTIKSGDIWHGELLNRRKDGSLYLEEQIIKPLIGAKGEITHFVAIKQDVSERRQTEAALRRAQKMEAVGHLAGGIAHDFNNQLGVVIGYLDFLERYLKEDEKAHAWVNTASQATLRCVDLVRQLLVFSRRQGKEQGLVDLNAELCSMDKLIDRSMTPAIEVKTELADTLLPVLVDAGEFQDTMLNLAINARDAMPEGGTLSIKTENLDEQAVAALNDSSLKPGKYVRVTVSDNGQGMSPTVQEHVFEPFFTTKSVDKGTGLGLAMVYGFMERYHGHIVLQSELGDGTIFMLYFPVSDTEESIVSEPEPRRKAQPTGGEETVLIVDDEVSLLNLADEYLTDLGYNTLKAESPIQAIELLRAGADVDVLFSDIVMPGGINGYDLAQQVSNEFPHIRILLTSGYASDSARPENAVESFKILVKPYRKEELAAEIRSIIGKENNEGGQG